MKVSCLPVSLFKEIIDGKIPVGQWASDARAIGLDGIDISMAFIKNHTPTYLKGLKQEIAQELFGAIDGRPVLAYRLSKSGDRSLSTTSTIVRIALSG
jgi:hypothetical protein